VAKQKSAADLLSNVDLFAELSKSELRKVAAIAKPFTFVEGESVTEEGTPGGRFHVIVSGTAKVVGGGRTRATLSPGEYFGELSLIDGEPRSATVVALEPLETLSIAEWNLRPLLKSQATISYKMLVVLARRVRSVMKSAYTTW
jgi:CRP/FNR family transcriptional regulator, cyclic AMP receptor protein